MYKMKNGGSPKAAKKQAAVAIAMKKAGKAPKKAMMGSTMDKTMMPKPMMKMGGSLKPVDKAKNPGLAKLPTPVRNKMGYKKYGGDVDMMQAGGVASKKVMAPMVDPKGAYTKVQERTLDGKKFSAKAKSGKSVKKMMKKK